MSRRGSSRPPSSAAASVGNTDARTNAAHCRTESLCIPVDLVLVPVPVLGVEHLEVLDLQSPRTCPKARTASESLAARRRRSGWHIRCSSSSVTDPGRDQLAERIHQGGQQRPVAELTFARRRPSSSPRAGRRGTTPGRGTRRTRASRARPVWRMRCMTPSSPAVGDLDVVGDRRRAPGPATGSPRRSIPGSRCWTAVSACRRSARRPTR